MKKILQRFYKKQDGAVAIIVAVALIAILFGVLSLSIDLNRTQTSYTHNYNGTDAAALAGAEMWLQGKISAIGKVADPLAFRPAEADMATYTKNVLIENFAQDQQSSTFLDNTSFKVTMDEKRQADGKTRYSVKVDACAQLDTPLADVPEHVQDAENPGVAKTCTTSTAGFDLGKLENTEVAFALDFTESMYWKSANQGCPPGGANSACLTFADTKAAALQEAMKYVFDKYFDSSAEGTAFASIVPYTSFVNAYPYADNGLVRQGTDNVSYSGLAFKQLPQRNGGFSDYTKEEIAAFYADSINALSIYQSQAMTKTIGSNNSHVGEDLDNYILDSNFHKTVKVGAADQKFFGFTPFYTSPDEGHDAAYRTKDYSYILNRIPTISDSTMLERIINNPDSLSYLPFNNYHDLVKQIVNEDFVIDPTISKITSWDKVSPINYKEQYAKMICYNYTVAAAADERVDGALISSSFAKFYNGNGKDIELHESFPIQPLTNNKDVLNNILNRYVATDRLSTGNIYNEGDVVDFESARIDKARKMSMHHKTSSIHGLMWAWFTVNNAWKDKWDELSLHEKYKAGSKDVRKDLPSAKNFKHIILISDGFDNDGCEDLTGGTASSSINSGLGRRNVCDAYTPVAAVTDEQYNDLCTTIKTNGTSDEKDDTSIHIIALDFDAGAGAVEDGFCKKAGGADNRFAKCANSGEYYEDVKPTELEKMFDDIFAGILTKAVPVRLLD